MSDEQNIDFFKKELKNLMNEVKNKQIENDKMFLEMKNNQIQKMNIAILEINNKKKEEDKIYMELKNKEIKEAMIEAIKGISNREEKFFLKFKEEQKINVESIRNELNMDIKNFSKNFNNQLDQNSMQNFLISLNENFSLAYERLHKYYYDNYKKIDYTQFLNDGAGNILNKGFLSEMKKNYNVDFASLTKFIKKVKKARNEICHNSSGTVNFNWLDRSLKNYVEDLTENEKLNSKYYCERIILIIKDFKPS